MITLDSLTTWKHHKKQSRIGHRLDINYSKKIVLPLNDRMALNHLIFGSKVINWITSGITVNTTDKENIQELMSDFIL